MRNRKTSKPSFLHPGIVTPAYHTPPPRALQIGESPTKNLSKVPHFLREEFLRPDWCRP